MSAFDSIPGAIRDGDLILHFGSPSTEQRALAAGQALVPLGDRTLIEVTGPDRLTWLDSITSQSVARLAPAESTELLVLDPQGHVEHAAGVFDDGETAWLIADAADADRGPGFAPVHEHWQVQHLLKINGGFEILRRGHGYVLDYGKRDARAIMADPPVVTLASREQDYSDPYFAMVFPKVVRLMRDSTILVIVGYRLPSDDALIRFFLRQFAEEPEDGLGKVIFYLGPGDAEEKRQTIAEVFPAMERMEAPQLVTYDSGFDQFAQECLDLLGRRG